MLTRGWMIVNPRVRHARDGIEHHAIERMRHGFDHAARGGGRELRVGVQGDYVRNGAREFAYAQNGGVAFTAEERVEIFQFAALAFAADPAVFAFRPHAGAVKQQEAIAGIAGVELFDAVAGGGENFGVAEGVDFERVSEVRKQAEENVGFGIRKKADFQLFYFLAHDVRARQHHGHDD